jgi:hypothetical protein
MKYIEKFIVNEEGGSLSEVFPVPAEKIAHWTNVCVSLWKGTLATDKILGKTTSRGTLIVDMLRECDPQNDPEVISCFVVLNAFFLSMDTNPSESSGAAGLLEMLKKMKDDLDNMRDED